MCTLTHASVVETVIEGKADAAGGRRSTDVRTAASSTRGKCFTTVAYSADGTCMLAGGLSKYVCIYAIAPRLLLRKFQLSHNRSLEGVLDKLNSSDVGAGGLVSRVDVSDSEDERAKM
jgi:periodic tryptophan protein 2